jgi:bifunctional NMN adenylyltransferase/nudix hydrolase
LNAGERIQDAVYRELREETKIKVPEAVLRGSTVTQRTFDDVHRSARGRTITSAFLIHLPATGELPKVKGADDAEKAKWVPLSQVTQDVMFEDHFHIIKLMTALI